MPTLTLHFKAHKPIQNDYHEGKKVVQKKGDWIVYMEIYFFFLNLFRT